MQVLALLVIGGLWARVTPNCGGLSLPSLGLVVVIVIASFASYRQIGTPLADLRALAGTTAAGDRVPPLSGDIRAGMSVFSEDPLVSVMRNQAPAVLDPYMLLRLADRHPEWKADLVRRIDGREFDRVVLIYPPRSAPGWYDRLHLGREVVDAIERAYGRATEADGYVVYARP